MCGIAGFIGNTDCVAAEWAVREMVCGLTHGGPNSEGMKGWNRGSWPSATGDLD